MAATNFDELVRKQEEDKGINTYIPGVDRLATAALHRKNLAIDILNSILYAYDLEEAKDIPNDVLLAGILKNILEGDIK